MEEINAAQPAAKSFRLNPAASTAEEKRRLRRMLSNRESARRSRMRKQLHLDNLSSELNRLNAEKQYLSNRLGAVIHFSFLLRRENSRLRSESAGLYTRLSHLRYDICFQQFQPLISPATTAICGGFGSVACGESDISPLIV